MIMEKIDSKDIIYKKELESLLKKGREIMTMIKKTTKQYILGYVNSPVGELMIATDGDYIKGVWIKPQKYFPEGAEEYGIVDNDAEIIAKAREWLERYFEGRNPDPNELPLEPEGTDFQKEVWDVLLSIPYGETMTYGGIGAKIAEARGLERMAAQAVGGAVGHNPISIIIPCHRVVGSNGSLTGYAGGLSIKKQLLTLEGLEINDNDRIVK